MESCDNVGIYGIEPSSDVALLVQYDEYNDIYTCRKCTSTFTTIELWEDHHLYYHFKPIYKCSICYLRFINIKTLTNHMRSEHSRSCYCCTICKQLFFDNTCFEKHMQECHVSYFTHFSNNFYTCRICTPWQRMSTIEHLLRHHETFHDPIFNFNFICHVCGKILDRNNPTTQRHLEQHYERKVRLCPLMCFKEFPTLIDLKKHVREDHPTQFLCERCFIFTNFTYANCLYIHEQEEHADQLELA